ncbi:hypothetical protein [Actinomadura hibisca]|uniref:hypothetical protein n=1 Tax=Actinomadura hibisca TaxID=68565 RepID=UPI00082EFA9B|nr:hypothetical protein [Actinomadura hibisca]
MNFDLPPSGAAPRDNAPTAEASRAAEEKLLKKIKAELEHKGEKAVLRRTHTGHPFLVALGRDSRFNEEITIARQDGRARAMWSWGEALPADIGQAIAAIRRVINPEA